MPCAGPTVLRCWTWPRRSACGTLGWRGPILLLEGAFEPRDLELCSRLDLWHAVHCDASRSTWLSRPQDPRAAARLPQAELRHEPAGFCARAPIRAAWARLNALPQVDEISLMTHFSDADGPRGIAEQMAAFAATTHDLPGERSLSNSAATLRHTADPAQMTESVNSRWCPTGCARELPCTAAHRIFPSTARPTGHCSLRCRLLQN
jgi:alanine racemase